MARGHIREVYPMTDLITAILLISGEPGIYSHPPTEADWPALRGSVHKVATAWEILDPRECSYVFHRLGDYQSDLDMLRRRNVELRDAPRLCESERFPARQWVSELCWFNRKYRMHLDERRYLELDREDILSEAICETDAAYRVYDLVRDARCDHYYTVIRRQALVRLREMLGEEDYAAVRLPPVVPVWRFAEGD